MSKCTQVVTISVLACLAQVSCVRSQSNRRKKEMGNQKEMNSDLGRKFVA